MKCSLKNILGLGGGAIIELVIWGNTKVLLSSCPSGRGNGLETHL